MSDLISGDRKTQRYELALAARFRHLTPDGIGHLGNGVTVELSRRSTLLISDEPPTSGAVIEVTIAWPFLLQNVCALDLIIKGRVLRISTRGMVIENQSYEFRTRGERSFSENCSPSSLSMIA